VSQGKTVPLAAKEAGITDQTYYRWRKEYGGLQLEQAKRLKDLQKENAQLKRALATLTLEKQILKDIAEGNFFKNYAYRRKDGKARNVFSTDDSFDCRKFCARDIPHLSPGRVFPDRDGGKFRARASRPIQLRVEQRKSWIPAAELSRGLYDS